MPRFNCLIFSLLFAQFLPAQRNADCAAAREICKKTTYQFDHLEGEGDDKREADFISCFMNGDNFGQAEENSTWIKFEVKESGSLTFTITPHKADNDIDFVVFKLPADGNCQHKQIVRCMAAGDRPENVGHSDCLGQTGLRAGERASSRDAGCSDPGDNTWLAPLKVVAGEKYVLLVSNVTESGPGFSINFGGTAKLPCDDEEKPAEKPKAKPKPEKPKPAPPKVVEPAEAPPVAVAPPPQIGERESRVRQTLVVKKQEIEVDVWDNQVEDGDVISLFLNEKKVVSRIKLTKKVQTYILKMDGPEAYLTVFADDFGLAEPASATVRVRDGESEQVVNLVAARSFQETIRIVRR